LMEWGVFFDWELKQHSKNDYYLAQIAGMLSSGKNTKISDFLIKFEKEKKKPLKIASKDQVGIFKKVFGIK